VSSKPSSAAETYTGEDLARFLPDDYGDDFTANCDHQWVYTGTAYGDDESYHGEGRCYCCLCGADGDG
jgi:hypothetical protein